MSPPLRGRPANAAPWRALCLLGALCAALAALGGAQQCGATGSCSGRCRGRGWAQWQYCHPLCARKTVACAGTCPSGAACGGSGRCEVTCARRFGRFCPWTRRGVWRYRHKWERSWVRGPDRRWTQKWVRRPRWVRVFTWVRRCARQNFHVCVCHSPCTCRGASPAPSPAVRALAF